MTGHEQPFNDLTLLNVPLHDFGHIRFRSDPIPDALGIDHHARPILAVIQASRLIGPDRSFQAESLDLFFEKGLKPLGSVIGAAATRVVFGPLVHADKDVMLERRHGHIAMGCNRSACQRGKAGLALDSLDMVEQLGDIHGIEQRGDPNASIKKRDDFSNS